MATARRKQNPGERLLDGRVIEPGDASWDAARSVWNLTLEQRPEAVVLAEGAQDVVAAVQLARDRGLRLAVQATGHGATALGDLEGTLLLRTTRMRGVEIDPVKRVARVAAGTPWMDVTSAASAHGLAGLAGSAPDVAVGGYLLGGGVSWLGRRHGLAANHVHAVEAVTAGGDLVRADHENHPDLFWALRGGGGSFAAVTAFDVALLPLREVYAGALFWPVDEASRILHAWRAWVETVPEEVTSLARLLNLPPLPDIPEPLRGRSFVAIEAVHAGDAAAAPELFEALRAQAPEIDTLRVQPVEALGELHMDPPKPVPGAGDGALLDELPSAAIDQLVSAAGPPLLSVEIRHLGGALASAPPGAGALGRLDAAFALYAVGMVPAPELKPVIERHIQLVKRMLAPWLSERHYLNFSERPGTALFADETLRRLREVKVAYDPGNMFRANHPITA